jgi:hypothetical protein
MLACCFTWYVEIFYLILVLVVTEVLRAYHEASCKAIMVELRRISSPVRELAARPEVRTFEVVFQEAEGHS